MAEVASAYVSLLPSARGFGSKLDSQIGGDVSGSGKRSGAVWGKVFAGAAALGVGALIKGTVGLEAQFSQTMNTIGAVTDVSAAKLAKLSDLALKMGADTSFSAGEASDAMLELAKGGMTAATIQAGGLAGTLKLAAAGGTSMETAATIASNAMNAFSLKGKDMNAVANALAGGANASSASVESLGQALSQVGPGAVNAGLSLQDTVATLSAFDAAGIKGSDAGTSLKTMLTRLIPATAKAKDYMDRYGLSFIKPNGEFKDMTVVAQELKDGLGDLSEAERSKALNTIFGSDASRAAAVLMKEGEQGIRGFIKATQDQGAAQRVADARMKGTAGAIEQFKGSVETAQIELGLLFAPAIQAGLGKLTAGVNSLTPAMKSFVDGIKSGTGVGGQAAAVFQFLAGVLTGAARLVNRNRTAFAALAATIGAVIVVTKAHGAAMAVQAAGGLAAMIKGTRIVTSVTKAYTAVQWLLNAALRANPIGIVITALAALGAGLVIAYKKSETFRKVIDGAFADVKAGAQSLANFVTKTIPAAFDTVVTYVRGIPGKIKDAFSGAGTLLTSIGGQIVDGLTAGIRAAAGRVMDAVDAIIAVIPPFIRKKMGIASPSKVTTVIGQQIMDGLKLGFDKSGKKVQERLAAHVDKIKSTFDTLKSDMASLSNSVASAFNPDMFGAVGKIADELNPATTALQEFMSGLSGNNSNLTTMLAAFDQLKAAGASTGFLNGLMQSGNTALATQLATAGTAAVQQASGLFDQNASLANQLGNQVAVNEYGSEIRDEMKALNREMKDAPKKYAKELKGVLQGVELVVSGTDAGQRAYLRTGRR